MEILTQYLIGQPWFAIVTATVTLASAIAALTTTPKSTSKLAKVYKLVDFLALNIGKAKDKGVNK